MPKPNTTCDTCGKPIHKNPYELKKNIHNYCSLECRGNNDRSKPRPKNNAVCARCGKQFHKKPNRLKRDDNNYCSFECRKKIVVKICEFCGKKFTPVMRGTKGDNQRFCSRKCGTTFIHRERSKRLKIHTHCHNCDKPIDIIPSKLPFSVTKLFFCSRKCSSEWHSYQMSGEGNPAWLGGHDSYRGPDWSRQRKKALKRDGYKCQVCGMGRKEHRKKYNGDLNVHHIEPYRFFRNNDLSNLITVCIKHHILIEKGSIPCPLPKK